MTFNECCALPNRTQVRLADGRVGVVAVTHKATATVEIQVGGTSVTVPCADLSVGPAGAVTHTPTAMLDPRTPGSTGRGQKTKTRQHQPVKSRR